MGKRLRYLMSSLPLIVILVVLWVPSHSSWKREMGSKMKPHNPREMVRDLLHYSDTHKSTGQDRNHPKIRRELVEVLTKPLSTIYQ